MPQRTDFGNTNPPRIIQALRIVQHQFRVKATLIPMKIAIASSGLGHISRGIETWARDTALALHERGVEVTLFAGGSVEGVGVSECRSESPYNPDAPPLPYPDTPILPHPDTPLPLVVLPCLRRYDWKTRWLARLMPGFCWRWGLKRGYDLEQHSFWLQLQRHLRRDHYDILHVQDPLLADLCRRARCRGRLSTREILAHGTEEPATFLARFDCLQHLAPWHAEQTLASLNLQPEQKPCWVAIPNFVDTDLFCPLASLPAAGHQRDALRQRLGIPPEALVLGCAAAVKKHHKRIDYLIREFAESLSLMAAMPLAEAKSAYLLIAGARQNDSNELVALAKQLAGNHIHVVFDLARHEMPDFYQACDGFVLASLFEMMPIAVLEALSSGLPVIANRHPVLEWMIGNGGQTIDMASPGKLANCLASLTPEWLSQAGSRARQQALAHFSKEPVIGHYIDYYNQIAAK